MAHLATVVSDRPMMRRFLSIGIVIVAISTAASLDSGCSKNGHGGAMLRAPSPSATLDVLTGSSNTLKGTIARSSASSTVIVASTRDLPSGPGIPIATEGIDIVVGGHTTSQSIRLLGADKGPVKTFQPAHQPFRDNSPLVGAAYLSSRLRLQRGAMHMRVSPIRGFRAPASVGSRKNFWVYVFAIGASSGVYKQLPATLEASSAHALIYVDDEVSSTLSEATARGIAADFENAYDSDTRHFGTSQYTANAPGMRNEWANCRDDGTPLNTQSPAYVVDAAKTTVLILGGSSVGFGVGGYFSPIDLGPQSEWNCATSKSVPHSNETPMIYVLWPDKPNLDFELREDMVVATAHEFQHLINFVHHEILAQTGNDEAPWINEGLSVLAQDLAVENDKNLKLSLDVYDAIAARAAPFLAGPQFYSLSAFYGKGPDGQMSFNCPEGCYGEAYLFQRYLYDRFGRDAYLHKMEQGTSNGFANLKASTSEDAADLIRDFGIALYVDGSGTSSDARFTFRGIDLRQSYQDQFNDPPVSLSGPAQMGSQELNSKIQYSAYLGSIFFVREQGGRGFDVPLTVSDPSGAFGISGGLAQRQ